MRLPGAGAALFYGGPRLRAWTTALAWLDHTVEVDGRTAWTVVPGRDRLAELRAALVRTVGDGAPLFAACGSRATSADRLPVSYAEAARLLGLGRVQGRDVLAYEDAGVLQVLLASPPERLRDYVQGSLGPVLERPDLLRTLRAWLAESGSRQSVSEQLHLHRNSVGYRVRRLKELLGLDPLEPAAAAQLHLALEALDLLRADEGTAAGLRVTV
ncbi:PucR family transcriptional regulator [Jatrophihabitans fulvus]